MGNCIYCGKPAGLLRSKHAECEERHQQRERVIQEGRQKICFEVLSAIKSSESFDGFEKTIAEIEKTFYVPSTERNALLVKGWEHAVEQFLEDGILDKINAWVAQQKVTTFNANAAKEFVKCLSISRGSNMYQAFMYVKKSDLQSGNNSVVKQGSNDISADKTPAMISVPEVVENLSAYVEYADFTTKMKQLKDEGKILSYARYASLDNPGKYYLAIYNREGKIVALLTPGNERQNVKTHKADSVKNYSSCGAIGFEIK